MDKVMLIVNRKLDTAYFAKKPSDCKDHLDRQIFDQAMLDNDISPKGGLGMGACPVTVYPFHKLCSKYKDMYKNHAIGEVFKI